MILLTGATGQVGSAVLRRLVGRDAPVRCLVRDPRRLGEDRVRVQIALGDLADPPSFRHALRGVDTVVHFGSSVRDQPTGSVEELNGVATWRLVRAAERAGVQHFVLASALGASTLSASRFLRSKALAEHAVVESDLRHTIVRTSLTYAIGDKWVRLLERAALLPVMPISGRGRALFQPIWVDDAADCVIAVLDGADPEARVRYELAGPDTLSYEAIVALIMRALGRRRPIVGLPLPIVDRLLGLVRLLVGPAAFATVDEVLLMEAGMTTPTGIADAERLGVAPRSMRSVLGALAR